MAMANHQFVVERIRNNSGPPTFFSFANDSKMSVDVVVSVSGLSLYVVININLFMVQTTSQWWETLDPV